MKFLSPLAFGAAGLSLLFFSDRAVAQLSSRFSNPAGYYPYTIARPEDRSWIRSLPVEQRPTRPLHFYGNRVRQSYHGEAKAKFTVRPTDRTLFTVRPLRSQGMRRFDSRRQ